MPILSINETSLTCDAGQSIFEVAESIGVRVPTSCNKNGKCRECMVEIEAGGENLTRPTAEEAHLSGDFRLACRACLLEGDAEVRCHTLRRGQLQIAEGGSSGSLLEEIDPAVTRQGDTVRIDGEVVATWAGEDLLGLAVDLGTTTVVVRLVDLESGEVRAVQSFENPQRFGGSDVMSRIQYDSDHSGRLLQRTLLGYLSHVVDAFGVEPGSIFEVLVVGNSTMRDLFFGLPVASIGQTPYRSETEHAWRRGERASTVESRTAKQLRLTGVHPRARVTSLPLISGHVGADTAACLLAIGLLEEENVVALMDIGTNTEFALGNREQLFVASCPAGPAFEGGLLSCGMPALEGAIESVALDRESGAVAYGVIGGGEALGICGSGIVDLLSELLLTQRMNELGRLADDEERFPIDEEKGLYLSEADISHLAQAKAANVAGALIVLRQSGIDAAQIEKCYLAGGFARHLDLEASQRIGLVPDFPAEKMDVVGNAAIEGATLALLSASRRAKLESLVKEARHIELETDPHFFDHFVEGCQFKPAAVDFSVDDFA